MKPDGILTFINFLNYKLKLFLTTKILRILNIGFSAFIILSIIFLYF